LQIIYLTVIQNIEECLTLNNKKINNLTENGQNPYTTYQKRYTYGKQAYEKMSISHVIRELQIKITLKYHYPHVRMAKILTETTTNIDEDVEQ
jgi:hypothetical protein